MAEGVAIPEEFLCPISRDVMREPVWLDTGITVDRAFAAYYLQAGFRTCPVTGESILSTRLIPVPFLRDLINRWADIMGYAIATQPTERVLTQAVIQAFDAARGKNGPTAPPALPRASREEMDEVAAAVYADSAPSSAVGPKPSLDLTTGMADLSVTIPTSPSSGALASAASEASTADGTFRDWISETRSELPSSSHSFASTSGRVDGGGLQSIGTHTQRAMAGSTAAGSEGEESPSGSASRASSFAAPSSPTSPGVRVIRGPGMVPLDTGSKRSTGIFGKVFGGGASVRKGSYQDGDRIPGTTDTHEFPTERDHGALEPPIQQESGAGSAAAARSTSRSAGPGSSRPQSADSDYADATEEDDCDARNPGHAAGVAENKANEGGVLPPSEGRVVDSDRDHVQGRSSETGGGDLLALGALGRRGGSQAGSRPGSGRSSRPGSAKGSESAAQAGLQTESLHSTSLEGNGHSASGAGSGSSSTWHSSTKVDRDQGGNHGQSLPRSGFERDLPDSAATSNGQQRPLSADSSKTAHLREVSGSAVRDHSSGSAGSGYAHITEALRASRRHTESADAATDHQLQTRSEGFPSGQVGDGGQPLRTASDTRPQSMAAAPGPPRSQQAPVMGLVVGQQVHVPPAQQRQQDQAEIMNLATQIKEVRDSRQVTIPALERLAAIVDGNDDMRTFFVESGGCARLSQLAASEHDSIKVAASRVVWYMARNPGVAQHLMGCNMVLILFQGLAKPDLSDPLPLIGGLVHFNCHNQELTPFRPAGISLVIEKLLVGCDTTEDALAAAFCLLRIHESTQPSAPQPTNPQVLKLIASAFGSVGALVRLLSVPYCSGSEAAVKLLGGLAQNVAGMASEVAREGAVPEMVELLRCSSASGRNAAAQTLAKLIAAYPDARAEIILSVATEPLCRMLQDTDQAGVEAAAWLLGYLATDPANGRPLISLGAAPALVAALQRGPPDGREGAAWAASSLAVDPANVGAFVQANAVPSLLQMLKTVEDAGKTLGRESALHMLACVARGGGGDSVAMIGGPGLQMVLAVLMARPGAADTSTREAALGVVRALCTQRGVIDRPNVSLVVDAGALRAIVSLMKNGSTAGRDSAAWALAELAAADFYGTRITMRREKAVPGLVAAICAPSVAGKEGAAVALRHLCSAALPGTSASKANTNKSVMAEIIRAHGLVGLNQLLLANTGSGKVAGARLVGVLAGSPDFHKSASRQGIVVNVAQLLAFESARVRTAAADALAAIGDSNAENWVVVQKGAPLLIQMLQGSDLAQAESAAAALCTVCRSPSLAEANHAGMLSAAQRLADTPGLSPTGTASVELLLSAMASRAPTVTLSTLSSLPTGSAGPAREHMSAFLEMSQSGAFPPSNHRHSGSVSPYSERSVDNDAASQTSQLSRRDSPPDAWSAGRD